MTVIEKTKSVYHVTISEAKTHLRIDTDFSDDDEYIDGLIIAAHNIAENYIGKDIAYTSNVANFYKYSGDKITIHEGNFIALQNVISDASTALSVAVTKQYYNYFEVELSSSISYTTDYTPLKVEFTTGYAANKCPKEVKMAILMQVANLYDMERSDYVFVSNKNVNASKALLNPHKIIRF